METVTVVIDKEQGRALRQATGQPTTRAAVDALIEHAATSIPNAKTRRAIARKGTQGDRVFIDPAKLKAHLRTLV
ncbi:MAG: hypothetical protein ACT4PG_04495 [Panacagrimonas sp.]